LPRGPNKTKDTHDNNKPFQKDLLEFALPLNQINRGMPSR